jgi:endonuclease YncB( thermonuclease family)
MVPMRLHLGAMRKGIAICCLCLLGWSLWPGPETSSAEAGARLVPVLLAIAPVPQTDGIAGPVRVIDGDTFDLGGVRIRLQGVDAPERGAQCRDARGRDWACGSWATAELRLRLTRAAVVCHDLEERTRGRVVARCTLDGEDLGALLLADGVVRACPRYARRHPHSQGYEAIEARAAAGGRGLHAGDAPPLPGFCTPRRRG